MNHDQLQNLLGAEKKWKEIQDTRKSIGLGEAEEAELKNRDDKEAQLLGEIMDAVNDIADMNNNNVPNLTLDQKVAMLNSDQKRIYDKIKQHLTKQKQRQVTMMSKLMTFNLYACLLVAWEERKNRSSLKQYNVLLIVSGKQNWESYRVQ